MEKTTSTLTTESRILDTARDLFFRQGIRSITMDDIATHLGISKKTIYQFYEDKKNLVHALLQDELNKNLEDMNAIREAAKDPVDEILKAMQLMSGLFNSINPSLFYDLQKYHPESWKLFKDFKDRELTAFVEENLRSGMKLELYRKDLKIKILAKLRIEMLALGFNPLAFPPAQFHLMEVQIIMIDMFLHGVVTLKGHKLINKYKQIKEDEE